MSEEKSKEITETVVCCGFDTPANFAFLQRHAQMFASSTLVSPQYQRNVANCAIAIEMAARMKLNPLMVMQNLYIVHGQPSWSSKFLMSAVNLSGRYTPLKYEIEGEDPYDKKYRVRAYATEKATGEKLVGEWIDWRMVDGEGWSSRKSKTGELISKWLTMAGQLFRYRAGTFWVRAYCPEISMGMMTSEELEDVRTEKDITPHVNRIQHTPQSSEDILSQLNQAQTAPKPKETFVFKAEADKLVDEAMEDEEVQENDYLKASQGD